ncbi:hypothetical protein ACFOY2_43380 [Nonomuraea purpurea]|uniref:Uncharacterized protein n=1 Tax=Nonomuraea purpurea TaxID=1849276 RepID=A0ABV8GJJ8_9ACTN
MGLSPRAAALASLRFLDDRWRAGRGEVASSPEAQVHVTPVHPFGLADISCPGKVRRAMGRTPRPPGRQPCRLLLSGMAHPRTRPFQEMPLAQADAWTDLRHILEADLRYRMRKLATGGLQALFADLNVSVHFDGEILEVDTRCQTELGSFDSLVLMPTLLCNRIVLLVSDPVVLLYPAFSAKSWDRCRSCTARDLRSVVGGNSLGLLEDLREPRTLEELACRYNQDLLVVRRDLAVLEADGLLSVCPGAAESYELSRLAVLLMGSSCSSCT